MGRGGGYGLNQKIAGWWPGAQPLNIELIMREERSDEFNAAKNAPEDRWGWHGAISNRGLK